jgi:hypothetical protein
MSLTFDAPGYVLDLPSEFLSTPCVTADRVAYEQAVRICERAAAQRRGDGDLA